MFCHAGNLKSASTARQAVFGELRKKIKKNFSWLRLREDWSWQWFGAPWVTERWYGFLSQHGCFVQGLCWNVMSLVLGHTMSGRWNSPTFHQMIGERDRPQLELWLSFGEGAAGTCFGWERFFCWRTVKMPVFLRDYKTSAVLSIQHDVWNLSGNPIKARLAIVSADKCTWL